MRKNVQSYLDYRGGTETETWLDLDRLARVDVSSEAASFPIEAALVPGLGSQWRAATPGPQSLRLRFDEPVNLTQIRVQFDVSGDPRTQEFSLRWSSDHGATFQHLVRQQFNFSPPSTTREEETYRVELNGVTDLELRIVPDLNGGPAHATLTQLRVR